MLTILVPEAVPVLVLETAAVNVVIRQKLPSSGRRFSVLPVSPKPPFDLSESNLQRSRVAVHSRPTCGEGGACEDGGS